MSEASSESTPRLTTQESVLGLRDPVIALARSAEWCSLLRRHFDAPGQTQDLCRLLWALDWDGLIRESRGNPNALLLVEVDMTRLETDLRHALRFQTGAEAGHHCLVGLSRSLDPVQRKALGDAGFALTLELVEAHGQLPGIADRHFRAFPTAAPSYASPHPTLNALVWQNLPWPETKRR